MFKRDDDGALMGLVIVLAVIAFIVYIIVILASIIIGAAIIAGLAYGGGTAVVNYVSSFKENTIESNKLPMKTAA